MEGNDQGGKVKDIFMGMAQQAFITSGLTALGLIEPTPGQQLFAGLISLGVFLILRRFRTMMNVEGKELKTPNIASSR